MKMNRLALKLLAGLTLALLPLTSQATVYLSWTECNHVSVPTLSTDDTWILSGPYRLRAKFIDGSAYGYHAATSFQNNGARLDSLPPPGTYSVVGLYWIRYTDYSYSTVAEIGPETVVSVTVDYTFAYGMNNYYISGYVADPQGGLSSLYSSIRLSNGNTVLVSGVSSSGNYQWSYGGSVTSDGTGYVTMWADGTSGRYVAPQFYYNNGGYYVNLP